LRAAGSQDVGGCTDHVWEVHRPRNERKGFFKESLIAFILSRIWRWTAAPGIPGGLSLPHGPVPAPKEKVYNHILEHLTVEGYPTEADSDFKKVNVNHLVYTIIVPVLNDFIRRTGRKDIQLKCEKDIISTDSEMGGEEEFVVVDVISVGQGNFILIVESRGNSVGKAMRQCLLAMKDMREHNGDGGVYGLPQERTGRCSSMMVHRFG